MKIETELYINKHKYLEIKKLLGGKLSRDVIFLSESHCISNIQKYGNFIKYREHFIPLFDIETIILNPHKLIKESSSGTEILYKNRTIGKLANYIGRVAKIPIQKYDTMSVYFNDEEMSLIDFLSRKIDIYDILFVHNRIKITGDSR